MSRIALPLGHSAIKLWRPEVYTYRGQGKQRTHTDLLGYQIIPALLYVSLVNILWQTVND